MTRLSGIQLVAVSLVLWALAVWVFSAPHPVETETTAAAGTPAQATGEKTEEPAQATGEKAEEPAQATGEKAEEPGAGASESAVAGVTTAPSAAAGQGAAVPPDPATGVGDSRLRDVSEHTGIETASEPSTAGAPATSAAEIRTPPAASGDSSQIALAAPPASGDPAPGSAAGNPMIPRDSTAGSLQGSAGRPDAPPGAAPPDPWFEHPMSRPPPPARSSSLAADGSAVAGQLNAARRASWEGRFADALSHYRAAARLRPNDYVVWGEMGNVLWTMRRWSEAAYALEGAATLLVQAGELRAASELVPSVGRIDPDAAYRVQRLVWAAAQRQSG